MTRRTATVLTILVAGLAVVLACGQQAPAAVLGQWLFEDGDGNATVDSSGNGYTGGLYDFFDTSPDAGQFEGGSGWADGALNFDGRGLDNTVADDTVRTSMPISAMSGTSFTVEAVVSHNWPGQNWSPFFGQSDDVCCPHIFFFGKRDATEQLHYNISGLGSFDSDPVPISDGNPHHIALVFDDNANEISVYFDHNLVQHQTSVGGTLDPFTPNTLWFGGDGHGATERWNGFAWEARVTVDDTPGDGTGALGPGAGFLPVPTAPTPPTPVGPQLSFADFSNPSAFRMRGTAGPFDDAIRLTSTTGPAADPNDPTLTGGSQVGAAMHAAPVNLAADLSFSTKFTVNMSDGVGDQGDGGPPGADGLTFVIHQDPRGALALGDAGGALGLGVPGGRMITPAVAIELDTWSGGTYDPNVGPTNGNHVGIDVSTAPTSLVRSAPGTIPDLNDGSDKYVWVDYDGGSGELEVRISATDVRPANPTIRKPIDLSQLFTGNQVYLGFTAATGGSLNNHDVLNWQFDSQESTSTPPGFTPVDIVFNDFADVSALTLNAFGASLPPASVAGRLRLTDSIESQGVSAMLTEPVTLADDYSFDTEFAFELTLPVGGGAPGPGADGFTFVIHTGPDGASAVGGVGGAQGLDDIGNFIAVDFDTYATGSYDPEGAPKFHVGIDHRLDGNLALTELPVFNNGGVYHGAIDYDGEMMNVYFWLDGSPRPETPTVSAAIDAATDLAPMFGFSHELYLGFTAGTGGAINQHEIISWEFHSDQSALLLGDVNLDGVVNGLDVNPFTGVLLGGTYQVEADMNEDGLVNGLDVQPFVDAVVGGGAQAVPEPSSVVLLLAGFAALAGVMFRQRR